MYLTTYVVQNDVYVTTVFKKWEVVAAGEWDLGWGRVDC